MTAPRTPAPDAAPLATIFDLLWGRDNPAMEGWLEAVESWSQAWGRSMLPVWPWVAAGAPPAAPLPRPPAGHTIQ